MQSITYDLAFGATAGAASVHPAADEWLTIEGGRLFRAGERYAFYGDSGVETVCAPETIDDADRIVADLVRMRLNVVRLIPNFSKKWLKTTNAVYGTWGMMLHDSDEGVTDNLFNETAMTRLDYLIQQCNLNGIYVHLTNNSYSSWLTRLGYPQGTYSGYGMMYLSAVARGIMQDGLEQLVTRVNTFTGVTYHDNPGLIWQFSNEDGLSRLIFPGSTSTFGSGLAGSATSTTEWLDQIVNSQNGNGYWKAEIDVLIQTYWTAKGWGAVPGLHFPTRAQAQLWSDTNKDRFVEFLGDTELTVIQEMIDWIRGFNANAFIVPFDHPYMMPLANGKLDRPNCAVSVHVYLQHYDGAGVVTPYKQRQSMFGPQASGASWKNGANWEYQYGGVHSSDLGFFVTEAGQYGDSRWNHEGEFVHCAMSLLQDMDGIMGFTRGQQKQQYKGLDGSALYFHMRTRKPGYMLAQQMCAPIFQHRMLDPLPDHVTTINLATWQTYARNSGGGLRGSAAAFNFQTYPSKGFLKKRLLLDWSEGAADINSDEWQNLLWADFTAATIDNPVVITINEDDTPQVAIHPGGWILNNPGRVVGWVNKVPSNGTTGVLSTGTLSESLDNVNCVLRSDGDWDLFTGPSTFYFHSHDFQTDSSGFSLTADGGSVASWGTFQNIRLRNPEAAPIEFLANADQIVSGILADDTLVELDSTYDEETGVLSFTTSPTYPRYQLDPVDGSPAPSPPPAPSPSPSPSPAPAPAPDCTPGGISIYTALATNPYPTDAGERVRQDAADQADTYPFIIFRRIAVERLRGLDGSLHATKETFHVECWGETREQSDELEAQVIAALEVAGYYPDGNEPDGLDPEVRVKAAVIIVDVWC